MLSKDSLIYPSFVELSLKLDSPFDSSIASLFDSLYEDMDGALQALPLDTIVACDHALALVRMHQIRLLGKTGIISIFFQQMKTLDDAKRATLHAIRQRFFDYCDSLMTRFSSTLLALQLESQSLDMTLMPRLHPIGRLHPLTQTMDDVVRLFSTMGFALAQGNDVEDDWHNFTALNIPALHPARQNHDTFYLRAKDSQGQRFVLRTHTSPVQIRTMTMVAQAIQVGQPFTPIRIIVPGRTYRADHDATHSPMFHQLEGLVIDTTTHFGHLKHTLMVFLQQFFDIADLPLRFRPSHFPFTEPSVEVDIGCSRKAGQLRIGGGDDWLEILGAGMVHPLVIANCGLDPALYQGFAFGMGLERLTMLKYGIPDLRPFFAGDWRWLSHYGFWGV